MSRSLYAKLHRRFGPKISGSDRDHKSLRKMAELRARFPELFEPPHQPVTKEDIPKNGISIDATASVARVVDEIVRQREADK